jgi:hypothetical protein
LTFWGRQAILPALMRRLSTSWLLLALLALGGCTNLCEDLGLCTNTCEKLGERICACSGGGTASATCTQQIKNLLNDVGIQAAEKDFCASRLDHCGVPGNIPSDPTQVSDVRFCEWINTPCGKVSCGLAYGDLSDPNVCPP